MTELFQIFNIQKAFQTIFDIHSSRNHLSQSVLVLVQENGLLFIVVKNENDGVRSFENVITAVEGALEKAFLLLLFGVFYIIVKHLLF